MHSDHWSIAHAWVYIRVERNAARTCVEPTSSGSVRGARARGTTRRGGALNYKI